MKKNSQRPSIVFSVSFLNTSFVKVCSTSELERPLKWCVYPSLVKVAVKCKQWLFTEDLLLLNHTQVVYGLTPMVRQSKILLTVKKVWLAKWKALFKLDSVHQNQLREGQQFILIKRLERGEKRGNWPLKWKFRSVVEPKLDKMIVCNLKMVWLYNDILKYWLC